MKYQRISTPKLRREGQRSSINPNEKGIFAERP